MLKSRNETEGLILRMAKICETLLEQSHTEAPETLEFKLFQPRETFSFRAPTSIAGSWMIGLLSLEFYNFTFNKNTRKY